MIQTHKNGTVNLLMGVFKHRVSIRRVKNAIKTHRVFLY